MKSTPSSSARRSTRRASSGSFGSPQIEAPVMRIAPKPSRFTLRSPPMVREPAAAAGTSLRPACSADRADKRPAIPTAPLTSTCLRVGRHGFMLRMLQPRPHEHHEGGRSVAVAGIQNAREAVGTHESADAQVEGIPVRKIVDVADRELFNAEQAAVQCRSRQEQIVLADALEARKKGMGRAGMQL